MDKPEAERFEIRDYLRRGVMLQIGLAALAATCRVGEVEVGDGVQQRAEILRGTVQRVRAAGPTLVHQDDVAPPAQLGVGDQARLRSPYRAPATLPCLRQPTTQTGPSGRRIQPGSFGRSTRVATRVTRVPVGLAIPADVESRLILLATPPADPASAGSCLPSMLTLRHDLPGAIVV